MTESDRIRISWAPAYQLHTAQGHSLFTVPTLDGPRNVHGSRCRRYLWTMRATLGNAQSRRFSNIKANSYCETFATASTTLVQLYSCTCRAYSFISCIPITVQVRSDGLQYPCTTGTALLVQLYLEFTVVVCAVCDLSY